MITQGRHSYTSSRPKMKHSTSFKNSRHKLKMKWVNVSRYYVLTEEANISMEPLTHSSSNKAYDIKLQLHILHSRMEWQNVLTEP
jgi:hypothetical protein